MSPRMRHSLGQVLTSALLVLAYAAVAPSEAVAIDATTCGGRHVTKRGTPEDDLIVGTTGAGENGLNANVFEYRAFTTVGYNLGPAQISVQWQYYPKLDLPFPPNEGWPSYSIFHLNGSYQLSEDIGIRAGIDNLFNKAPPLGNIAPNPDASLGQLAGGSFLGAHDTNGRSIWLGANIRF